MKFTIQQLQEIVEYFAGMPCFILLAKDNIAPGTVQHYIDSSRNAGGTNTSRSWGQLKRMAEWREQNPDRCKLPD